MIVIVSEFHDAFTPRGSPLGAPIPVAPEVVCLMGTKDVFTHIVGVDEAAVTLLFGAIVIEPVASTVPHPPVNGIV